MAALNVIVRLSVRVVPCLLGPTHQEGRKGLPQFFSSKTRPMHQRRDNP